MNIDEWIELKLKNLRMFFVTLSTKKRILKKKYSNKSKKIIRYFMILQKSFKINIKNFRKWKINVFKFKIQNYYFFRRNSKNIFMHRVINNLKKKYWKIYMTKLNIAKKKKRIVKLLIDINEIIYTKKFAIMWKIAIVVDFVISFVKKKFYIRFEFHVYEKKLQLT